MRNILYSTVMALCVFAFCDAYAQSVDAGDKPIVIRVEKDQALEALEAEDRAQIDKVQEKESKRTLFSIFKRFRKSKPEESGDMVSSEEKAEIIEKSDDTPQRYLFGSESSEAVEESSEENSQVKEEKRRWFFFKQKKKQDEVVATPKEEPVPAVVAEEVDVPVVQPKKKKSFSLFKFGKKKEQVTKEEAPVIEEAVPSIFKKDAHSFSVVEEGTESSSVLPERLPGDKHVRNAKPVPLPVLRPKRVTKRKKVMPVNRAVEVLEEKTKELSGSLVETEASMEADAVISEIKEEASLVAVEPVDIGVSEEEVAPSLPVIDNDATLVVEDETILDIPTPEMAQEEILTESSEEEPEVPLPHLEIVDTPKDAVEEDISLEEVFVDEGFDEEEETLTVADASSETSSEEAQIEAAQDAMIARLKEENVHPDLAHEVRMVFSAANVELTEEMKEGIRLAVERWKDLGKRWQVMSYATKTDTTPSSDRRIALQRAIAVRSYLIEAGVSSLLINVQALGQKEEYTAVDEVVIKLIP